MITIMKKLIGYILSVIILAGYLSVNDVEVLAVNTLDKKAAPPEIVAQAGVLIEANSGTVLYNKDMNGQMYPASITKIMTTLLAIENSSLDETVKYSHYAVYSLEPGAAHIAMKENEEISMKDTLHGVMLNSANECANAAAEHVGKKLDAYEKKIAELKKNGEEYSESKVAISCFAELMNKKAKEVGAKNTHFVNPHGLFDENHYTTCYDMAMITREAIKNDTFLKIEANTKYTIEKTALTNEERYLINRHKMLLPTESVYYEGAIAGKTGYVDQSGNTLVTVAKKDNMTLISVVMKSDTYNVYSDTKALLDYGFNNYSCVNIAENETKFSLSNDGFFASIGSIFAENTALLTVNPEGYVVMPNKVEFSKLKSEIIFDEEKNAGSNSIATINYYYGKQKVGSTTLDVVEQTNENSFEFGPSKTETVEEKPEEKEWLKIDVRIIFAILIIIIVLIFVLKYLKYTGKREGNRRRIRRERYGRRGRKSKLRRMNRRNMTKNIHHRHRHY